MTAILARPVQKAFRTLGSERSAGFKVVQRLGRLRRAGVYEFPLGLTLRCSRRSAAPAKAVQVGSASGVCVPAKAFDRRLAFPGRGDRRFDHRVPGRTRDMLAVAKNGVLLRGVLRAVHAVAAKATTSCSKASACSSAENVRPPICSELCLLGGTMQLASRWDSQSIERVRFHRRASSSKKCWAAARPRPPEVNDEHREGAHPGTDRAPVSQNRVAALSAGRVAAGDRRRSERADRRAGREGADRHVAARRREEKSACIPRCAITPDLRVAGIVPRVRRRGRRQRTRAACAYPVTSLLKVHTHAQRCASAAAHRGPHAFDALRRVLQLQTEQQLRTKARQGTASTSTVSGHVKTVAHPEGRVELLRGARHGQGILCRRCVHVHRPAGGRRARGDRARARDAHLDVPRQGARGRRASTAGSASTAARPALHANHTSDEVWRAIDDPTKHVVIQTAPSPRAAIGECFKVEPGPMTASSTPRCGSPGSTRCSTRTSPPTSRSSRKAPSCSCACTTRREETAHGAAAVHELLARMGAK